MTGRDAVQLFYGRGWLTVAIWAIAVVAGVLALGGLGFRFDPFDRIERRADRAESAAQTATVDGHARAIEVEAAADTAARLEVVQRQVRAADAIVHQHARQAEAALDAQTPLDPDRLARLRSVDRQLCDLRPAVCAASAASTGDAAGG